MIIYILLLFLSLLMLVVATYIEPSDPFLVIELSKKKLCATNKVQYELEINKNQELHSEIEALLKEGNEILAIIVTSIKTSRNNQNSK